MLRTGGFSDLHYMKVAGSEEVYPALASGELDISIAFVAPFIVHADARREVVMLAGIHTGCIELYGSERVRTVRDLKGRTASVVALNSALHAFIASMVSYVGIDPRRDINWVVPAARAGDAAVRRGQD